MRRGATIAVVALLSCAAPARAEDLVLAVSSARVVIASNYAGADVTLFGTARPDRGQGAYDLVVTTRGPTGALVVREKERTAGIWLNGASRGFPDAPTFLAVASNRPIADIAAPETIAASGLGLPATLSTFRAEGRPGGPAAPLASALLRLQTERGHWSEDPAGVGFLEGSLFRATIALPPDVPLGAYAVEARLFASGREVARRTVAFQVEKAGFEARIADLAENRRLAYGVVTAMLAVLFGWLASAIFRQD